MIPITSCEWSLTWGFPCPHPQGPLVSYVWLGNSTLGGAYCTVCRRVCSYMVPFYTDQCG